MAYDMKFPVEFVIAQTGYEVGKSGSNDNILTICPSCGKMKNYISKTKEVYFCQSCNDKGGISRFYQKAKNLPDTKTAFKELCEIYQSLNPDQKTNLSQLAFRNHQEKETNLASPVMLNKYNTNLINSCCLADRDRQDLIGRGLSDEIIQKYRIKSTPQLLDLTAKKMLGSDYHQLLPEFAKNGSSVPGLYYDNGQIFMARQPHGIMIPVVDRYGRTVMFQIRKHSLPANASQEQKKKFNKYIQFASGFVANDTGCTTAGITKIHHVGFDFSKDEDGKRHTPEVVRITEGCLKADVASYLEGNAAYIAILGVSYINETLEDEFRYLFEHGTNHIDVRLDMDFITNAAVAKAIVKINTMLMKKFHAVPVLIEPTVRDLSYEPCIERFYQIMDDEEFNPEKISFVAVNTKEQLENLIKSGKHLVYNNLWNPEYKGIDDYLLAR